MFKAVINFYLSLVWSRTLHQFISYFYDKFNDIIAQGTLTYIYINQDRNKVKILNTYKPFGTYTMYTAHMLDDGTFNTCDRHQLIKGMSCCGFSDLFHDHRSLLCRSSEAIFRLCDKYYHNRCKPSSSFALTII